MDDFEYRRPPKVNRYWNRPKPKVYDCNLRDAERVYQDSYKQYLAEKDFRLKGDRAWSTEIGDRFAHLRAGPVHRRETSAGPSSSARSRVEEILARTSASEEDSTSLPTTSPLRDIKPLPVYDPQKENASLEERLARLKKLREELGLPGDSQASQNTLRESANRTVTTSVSNDIDSSYKADRSPRLSSRSGAAASSDESSSYSYKSERSAKVNGIGDDYKLMSERSTDEFKLTPRSERKREERNVTPKLDEFKLTPRSERKREERNITPKLEKKPERFSKLSATTASSSSPTRTRKAIKTTEVLDFDEDDDSSVVKMMKKMPSSQEILDRISKMDLDD